MKILHLISGGDTGGAKTHVLTLLKKLKQIGVNVSLLCIMESDFTKQARDANIPVTIIYQASRISFKEIVKIKNFIKNNNFDLVHCHGARANYIAFFIKNKLNVPFLTTLHSDYKLDFKDNLYKNLIFTPINSICLKSFKYILTVTDSFKKMMINRNFKPQNLTTIYNGISFEENFNITSKEEFLKNYEIQFEKDKVYIGLVARLQAVKGIKYFLMAINHLINNDKDDKIRVLIAGSGTLQNYMEDFIKKNNLQDKVKMLGFVKDVNSFYNIIDINVLSSLSESFPYSLLEGARQKKATIATAVGGIPEMIKDGKTGLLVQPKNYLALADKLQVLAESQSLRESLGQNFYYYAKENFSDDTMANVHKNIYNNILKESKKSDY